MALFLLASNDLGARRPPGQPTVPIHLWLCGPPGAGKSAVGWALYDGLARSGARAGFADIGQLGMCLPALAGDPERFGLKERNVSAVAANFRAAGCGALVVSGDLGLSTAITPARVGGASLTVCRLRASPGELRRRLTGRGAGTPEQHPKSHTVTRTTPLLKYNAYCSRSAQLRSRMLI